MDQLKEYYHLVIANPLLKSASLVLIFVFIAKITDVVFTFIFKKFVDKTETKLDDRIVQLLHKPIFYSILFVGFIISIRTATLPDYIEFFFVGGFNLAFLVTDFLASTFFEGLFSSLFFIL